MSHEPYGPNVQIATFNYGMLQMIAVTPGAIGYVAHAYLNNQVKLLPYKTSPLHNKVYKMEVIH